MQWHRQNMLLRLSVNLSVQQLQHDSWLSVVEEALSRQRACRAHYLDLEITESVIITHPEKAVATLVRLKQMGVSITVDDFGTGYSCLSYLARLPIQGVKIDQRFVHGLEHEPQRRGDHAGDHRAVAFARAARASPKAWRRAAQFDFLKRARLRGGAGLPHRPPARGAGAPQLVADYRGAADGIRSAIGSVDRSRMRR